MHPKVADQQHSLHWWVMMCNECSKDSRNMLKFSERSHDMIRQYSQNAPLLKARALSCSTIKRPVYFVSTKYKTHQMRSGTTLWFALPQQLMLLPPLPSATTKTRVSSTGCAIYYCSDRLHIPACHPAWFCSAHDSRIAQPHIYSCHCLKNVKVLTK